MDFSRDDVNMQILYFFNDLEKTKIFQFIALSFFHRFKVWFIHLELV